MKKRILVVEDDPYIQRLLCLRMRRSYELFTANNGIEAVKMADSLVPDLILMDITMPEMDGLEASRLIRQNPKTSTIPILAATARVTVKEKEEIRTRCIDDVVIKPYSYKELAPHIETLLNANRASS